MYVANATLSIYNTMFVFLLSINRLISDSGHVEVVLFGCCHVSTCFIEIINLQIKLLRKIYFEYRPHLLIRLSCLSSYGYMKEPQIICMFCF